MANDRAKICKKVYVTKDGTEVRSASPEVDRLEFRFADGSDPEVIRLSDFNETINACFGWNGAAQKLGDGYASAEDVEDAHDRFLDLKDRLVNGMWVRETESAGPRIGLLVTAIARAQEKAGQTPNLDRIAEVLRTDDSKRKGALDNPQIKAEYEALRAEAAAERAKKAAEVALAAGGTPMELGAFA